MEAGGKVQLTHAPPLRRMCGSASGKFKKVRFPVTQTEPKPPRSRRRPARRPPPPAGASPDPRARRAVAPALRRSARRCFTQGGRGGSFILDLYPILIYPDFKLSGDWRATRTRPPARLCAARGATDRTAYYPRTADSRATRRTRRPRATREELTIRNTDYRLPSTLNVLFWGSLHRFILGITTNAATTGSIVTSYFVILNNNIERQVRAT